MSKRSVKWHDELVKDVQTDPEARVEYEAFKLQLMLADKFKHARKKSHLTQQNVADRMGTQKPVVARLEAAGGKGKHSPSLKTVVKYAEAVGYHVQIKLVPAKSAHRRAG